MVWGTLPVLHLTESLFCVAGGQMALWRGREKLRLPISREMSNISVCFLRFLESYGIYLAINFVSA